MRFLHTSDWHVGRTIRGRSRVAEFEAVLTEIVDIARREQVDAILVCGDIWDHHAPSAESDRIVHSVLRECIGLGVQVVLLAGNHDNPGKLHALGLLSDLLGVQTQSHVLRPDAGGILTIEGRDHTARIAAIPFVTEGRYVGAAEMMRVEADRFGTYADGVAAILDVMCATFTSATVNILATHAFIDQARIATRDGSERRIHIGQTYAIRAAALPPTPQYIALGHVHEPQRLTGLRVPAAYSGSILQLDFGERGQRKMVRIIDAVPGRPVEQTEILLTSGRPLVEIAGTPDEVLAAGIAAGDAHMRLRLDLAAPESGLIERLRDALPGVVDVQLAYDRPEEDTATNTHMSDADLFAEYYVSQYGAAPAPEIIGLLEQLLEEIDTEEAVA